MQGNLLSLSLNLILGSLVGDYVAFYGDYPLL